MTLSKEQLNKHWDTIVAYKNGATIEGRHPTGPWTISRPSWFCSHEYRVKKESIKYQLKEQPIIEAIQYKGVITDEIKAFFGPDFYLRHCGLYLEAHYDTGLYTVELNRWIVRGDDDFDVWDESFIDAYIRVE